MFNSVSDYCKGPYNLWSIISIVAYYIDTLFGFISILTCPNSLGFKSLTFSPKNSHYIKNNGTSQKKHEHTASPSTPQAPARNQTRNLWFPKCRVSFSSRTSVLGAVAESATQLVYVLPPVVKMPSHERSGAEDSLECCNFWSVAVCNKKWFVLWSDFSTCAPKVMWVYLGGISGSCTSL